MAPWLPLSTRITDTAEKPATPAYAHMTTRLLADWGWTWEKDGSHWILHTREVPSSLAFRGERDWSGAAFFWGWVALAGGNLTLKLEPSFLQPEARALPKLLPSVRFTFTGAGECFLEGAGQTPLPLQESVEDTPDLVPMLAVVAAFASAPSQLTGIHTLPHKESNRLAALAQELSRIGASLSWDATTLHIRPVSRPPQHPVVLDSHGDHRIAMALSLVAARAQAPIYIQGAGCVAKSFPSYWQMLENLGLSLTFVL
uniref:3-phosphoshikimate 1-carboxyvinyltransferase n=1 Tax=uncultured Bacteroidota bacterium TaxID=152509 RepID=H5SMR1_9BACT|nr:3-phosphoshikimate 1-carboxyvinyltransferase [uncultured Bacteroidetes bacterium]